jgi:hypothetical protein
MAGAPRKTQTVSGWIGLGQYLGSLREWDFPAVVGALEPEECEVDRQPQRRRQETQGGCSAVPDRLI